jgi:calpain-7
LSTDDGTGGGGEILWETSQVSEDTGLLSNHAYALLDVKDIGYRLVKLRNPWNSQKWKGKFSDLDKDSWTKDLQTYLDYDIEAKQYYQDGTFWISWEDLCHHFANLSFAWNPDYYPFHCSIHHIHPEFEKDIVNF